MYNEYNDSPEAIELMEEVAEIIGENISVDPNIYGTDRDYYEALQYTSRKVMEHIRDTMFTRLRS